MLAFLILLATVAFVLSLFRLFVGPNILDRVVSLELMSTIVAVILAMLSFYFEREFYLDVAFVFALIGFIASVAFARYKDT